MLETKIRMEPDLINQIDVHAQAAGLNRADWMRQALAQATSEPVVRSIYYYRGYAENGALAIISRDNRYSRNAQCTFQNATQEQADACRRAELLVISNEPGDLQEALALLASVGFRMIEVAR